MKESGASSRNGWVLESGSELMEEQGAGKKAMTKIDLVEQVYAKVGSFSKKDAAEIVELVFDTIKQTLEKGEKIKISGFGNFVVRQKKARIGRNPQTGEEIEISARRVLTFKPSQVLKSLLNQDRPQVTEG
jgi:integration host factor subunit alpha